MLAIENLPAALTALGFKAKGQCHSKAVGTAKGEASKSINQANINATVMRSIEVPVPPLAEQQRLVAKVQALEQKIAEAQAVIAGAPARKQAILQRYL